jgi:ATP-dependent Clp protease ATP-binding subunit ClpC
MLNPGLDIDYWVAIAYASAPGNQDMDDDLNFSEIQKLISKAKDRASASDKNQKKKPNTKKISKQKYLGLEHHLKSNIIGQDEAVDSICAALLRSQAGLNDDGRPLGVFLFAGSSGVGKTHLASTLHNYLFAEDYPMVRIDCGEFQHKHENQKLIGSPPGYVGHDEGGQLVNQIKKHPHSVVLIDEVEKAHPDIWNTFLSIFDEGFVTDGKGDKIDFRDTVIVMTTNLGNDKTVDNLIGTGAGFNRNVNYSTSTTITPPRQMVEKNTLDAIRKYFKPELINRLDKIVVFNHLNRQDCEKIAELEMDIISEKMIKKGYSIEYDESVINGLIDNGIDTIKGARGLSQIRREQIETKIAKSIVMSHMPKGTVFIFTYKDNIFNLKVSKPARKLKVVED